MCKLAVLVADGFDGVGPGEGTVAGRLIEAIAAHRHWDRPMRDAVPA